MDHITAMANQIEWAAKNLAYNLDFVPADKLDWKPAPTANSALEVVGHVLGALNHFLPLITGGDKQSHMVSTPAEITNVDEAKTQLLNTAADYAQALRSLTPERLSQPIELPFGTLPLGFVASMAVTDLIHHHGQIAYIQTLLGDTESHFDMSLLPKG